MGLNVRWGERWFSRSQSCGAPHGLLFSSSLVTARGMSSQLGDGSVEMSSERLGSAEMVLC